MIRITYQKSLFNKNSFTLLEILITIVVLTIGIIALSQAFSTAILTTSDIENVDLALNIAQAKMEEIKDTVFASLADSGPSADANFSNFNVSVNVAEGNDPMRVDVTVSWNAKGGPVSITLTTLRADI